jgi:hypothetical protein
MAADDRSEDQPDGQAGWSGEGAHDRPDGDALASSPLRNV